MGGNELSVKIQHFFERMEQYFLEIIQGRRRRPEDRAMTMLLFVASRFYRMAVQMRLWLYTKRFYRPHAIGCLVVSIGNVSCGGTGKTPVVEVFAKTLTQKGRKVAILSRGYRSKQRSFLEKMQQKFEAQTLRVPPKVVSIGDKVLLGSDYAGDEPFMLASNLKGVAVLVDKDRVNSGLYAIEELCCDTLIMDDGFQYLKLKPHINIALVDSTDPFGNHHVLPRGILREPIKNLRRADYIFLTKSNGGPHLRHLKSFLRRHNRRAEIIECCHSPKYLQELNHPTHREDLARLKGAKVAALSAIANPKSFEDFLEELGAAIVHKERFADHHRYTDEEISAFARNAAKAGAEFIVTTEKDAVRLPDPGAYCRLKTYFLRVEIDILSGRESFDQCISRICFL